MSTTKHTPGAMRAAITAYCIAREIYPIPDDVPARWSDYAKARIQRIAVFIDQETAAERDRLKEACVKAVATFDKLFSPDLLNAAEHIADCLMVIDHEIRDALANTEPESGETKTNQKG